MNISLDHYRVFYYVSKTSSISQAAKGLFLSQPAVTRTIHKLEQSLGCQLFLRQPRGVQLTPEGEVLFSHISQAMAAIDAGEDRIRRLISYEAGSLSIGVTENALHYFLLPKLLKFRQQYPRASVHVSSSSTQELLSMARRGTVDLALVMEPLHDAEGLRVSRLRSFQDIFIAGSAFAHLRGKAIPAHELCRYPIIGLERGTSANRYISSWFEDQGLVYEPQYSVRTSTLVLPFVTHGLGIGLVPEDVLRDPRDRAKNAADIFEVRLINPPTPRYMCLVYSDSVPASALGSLFMDFIR